MNDMPTIVPGRDEVLFVPLGGVGEIGMNTALYGHDGAWIMVDLGVVFGDETTPGVDVILPDIAFALANRDTLAGLVLTHAHEDHVGALPHLWHQLGCPIYATPFTAAFVRRKFQDEGLPGEAAINVIERGGSFRVGPFEIETLPVTHSLPEACSLVLRTALGAVVHTGDWKLDPGPVIEPPTDPVRFQAVGEERPLAVVCDSTNAMVAGHSGSEAALYESLAGIIDESVGRVVVTCFASNVARLQTVAQAAARCGRRVALVGRSLRRIDQVARACGYLKGVPEFIGEEHVGYLPREEVVLICTGSQGEPRAALRRIADGTHPHVALDPGDTVVFSSRVIPGNEKAIYEIENKLLGAGLRMITAEDHFVHVSGHPAREELATMYGWLRPRHAIPVHGEARHLLANAAVAKACGVPGTTVISDGKVVRIARDGVQVTGEVPVGRRALDGRRLIALDGDAMRTRRRLLEQGTTHVTLVVDGRGEPVGPPQLSIRGVIEADEIEACAAELAEEVERAVRRLQASERDDDERMREAVRIAVRRAIKVRFGKRPVTDVHLVRI